MSIYTVITCPEVTLSTCICTIVMWYAVWIYNRIHDIKYGISNIEILLRLMLEPVSQILIKFYICGCPKYFLGKSCRNLG